MAGPLIDNAVVEDLDLASREIRNSLSRKGLRAHTATAPVFRLCGPLPPPYSHRP